MIKLKAYSYDDMIDGKADIDVKYYTKEDADTAIATLQGANDEKAVRIVELQKQVDELEDVNELIKTARKMLEDAKATAYTESVDAGMENRKLKRALWLARANRAQEMAWNFHEKNLVEKCAKWDNVHLMCRAKAEEYK